MRQHDPPISKVVKTFTVYAVRARPAVSNAGIFSLCMMWVLISLLTSCHTSDQKKEEVKESRSELPVPVLSTGNAKDIESEINLLNDRQIDCYQYDTITRMGYGMLKDGYHFSFNSWQGNGERGFKCVLMISNIQDTSWTATTDEKEDDFHKRLLEQLKPLLPRIIKDKETVSSLSNDLRPGKLKNAPNDPLSWYVESASQRYSDITIKMSYVEFCFIVTVYCSNNK